MVEATEETADARTKGFRWYIQRLADYFYATDILLESTRVHWIQRAFDVLAELFDHIGLHTNVVKMVIMEYQPCCMIGGHSTEAYSLTITG